MRRMHVIDSYDRMGGEIYYRHADKYRHDPELLEAYHCGHKEGRKEAYKEIMEEQYGGSYHHRDRWRDEPPMMREHEHDWDDDEEIIKYRRGRDSMGRYVRR